MSVQWEGTSENSLASCSLPAVFSTMSAFLFCCLTAFQLPRLNTTPVFAVIFLKFHWGFVFFLGGWVGGLFFPVRYVCVPTINLFYASVSETQASGCNRMWYLFCSEMWTVFRVFSLIVAILTRQKSLRPASLSLMMLVVLNFTQRGLFFCFFVRFNYRSTHHLTTNGFYEFLNWFDERAWYPLGRIVGGTVSLSSGSHCALFLCHWG